MTARPLSQYELVENHSYMVTADDVDEFGHTRFGLDLQVPMYVLLCHSCDHEVPADGLCHRCCLVHLDVAEHQVLAVAA